IIMAHFTDKVNSGEYKTLEDLGNALCTGDHIPFAAAGMPVEEGYLNGFSEEISGFTDGYMFGPMIGAIPFVGYVFTVEDQTKTDEFMNTLNEKADLCWNICTAADEKYSAAVGNTVCFVMCPLSLEEE
ncbi:MAG: hypothetical protein HUJ80_06965, partial [Firmicutes bacterium]|nr:hypothetical protein [Bacillota bacterium]